MFYADEEDVTYERSQLLPIERLWEIDEKDSDWDDFCASVMDSCDDDA